MQPIMIMCHWHTGSRMLGRLLYGAGMEVGNEACGFVDRVPGQEHPDISYVTSSTFMQDLGRLNFHSIKETAQKMFQLILQDYKKEGEKNNWKFYGIKNNFLCDQKVWEVYKDVLFEAWPDVKIVISTRHPIDIFKTANNPEWSVEDVANSYIRSYGTIKELVENKKAILMLHPDSFQNINNIKKLISFVGIKWKKEIEKAFDINKVNNLASKSEKESYAKMFPKAAECFDDLCKLATVSKSKLKKRGK